MADQVLLQANVRTGRGKGAAGRLRRQGRVPAVLYGYNVEPTPVDVDALELYHALHTEAALNVLIRLRVDGTDQMCVARDLQRHPLRGDVQHADFIAVDPDVKILVEIPVSLEGEDEIEPPGVLSHMLYSVPAYVRPIEIPNQFTMSVAGMAIGDVQRVEDLADQLPEGAEFDIEPERTVVTVNPPDLMPEPETDTEAEEARAEATATGEAPDDAGEVPADAEPTSS